MRDLFSAPDPYAAHAFAHDPTQGALSQTPKARLAHMVEAYSRAFLLTGPNVRFRRYMLDRKELDGLARRTMASEWAESFALAMGRYYRYDCDCDYAEQLQAAVDAAGRWPWCTNSN